MVKRKPWLETRLLQKAKALPLRKKYLIVTEGATEAAYLSHFKTSTGPYVVVIDAAANKLGLVRRTLDHRNELIRSGDFIEGTDTTWVVLDRDVEPTNPKDKANFNAALDLANRSDIKVAYSNDAFEIWYLLHYQEVSGPLHRSEIEKKLSGHLGRTYKPSHGSQIEDLYEDIEPMRDTATRRAIAMQKRHLSVPPESANPCTMIHLLLLDLVQEGGFRAR